MFEVGSFLDFVGKVVCPCNPNVPCQNYNFGMEPVRFITNFGKVGLLKNKYFR